MSAAYFCRYAAFSCTGGAAGSTLAVPVTITMLELGLVGHAVDQQARAVPDKPDRVGLGRAVLAYRHQPADRVFAQAALGADAEIGAGIDQRLHVRHAV